MWLAETGLDFYLWSCVRLIAYELASIRVCMIVAKIILQLTKSHYVQLCLCACAWLHVMLKPGSLTLYEFMCVCVRAHVYMCECVCARVRVYMCECVFGLCMCVHACLYVRVGVVVFCCMCDDSWLYNNCNPWRALIRAFCTIDSRLRWAETGLGFDLWACVRLTVIY